MYTVHLQCTISTDQPTLERRASISLKTVSSTVFKRLTKNALKIYYDLMIAIL